MAQQLFNANVPITSDDNDYDCQLNGPVTIDVTNYGTIDFDLTLYCLVFDGTEDGQLTLNLKCSNESTEDLESVMRRLKGTVDVTHYDLIIDNNAYSKPLVYMGHGEFIAAPFPQTNCTAEYGEYKINLCLSLEPLPPAPSPPAPNINGVLSGLRIGHRLYPQIEVAPADFTTEPGARFVVLSNEGGKFYVHSKVLDEFCPVFKSWVQENRDGFCDGVALNIDCSTAALTALLTLIYKQEVVTSFGTVLPEVLEVCDYWRITAVLDVCGQYIRDNYTETQADFDVLLGWFVSVSVHLVDGELEATIFKQLICLAGEDKEKKARLETQMVDYQMAKTPQQSAAFVMKIGESWAKEQ